MEKEEADAQLRAELLVDQSAQLSAAKFYGWDFARCDAEQSVESMFDELQVIDDLRVSGHIDKRKQDRLASDSDALIERIRRVRHERFEAFGFAMGADEPIRTPSELRRHISQTINSDERAARAWGRSRASRDYTKENQIALRHAQRLFDQFDILSPPPVPLSVDESHYLHRLLQWCVTSERLAGIVELEKRMAFLDIVRKTDSGLKLIRSLHREIFRTLNDIKRCRSLCRVRFTCDVEGMPAQICYSLRSEESVRVPPGLKIEGLCIPFKDFRLENASGRRPRWSHGHALEEKLGILLGRLHLIMTALDAATERVCAQAGVYASTEIAKRLKAITANLPRFPFPTIFAGHAQTCDAAQCEFETMVADAREELNPLISFDAEYAPDVAKFRPMSFFDKDSADDIRHAAEPDRKRKRVAKIMINGEPWFCLEHVQWYYPEAIRDQKGA